MIDLKDLKEKTSLIYKKYNDFLAQQSLLSDTVAEIANLNSQRRKLERKKDQYNRKLSKINSSNINPIKKQQKLDSLNQEYDLSAIQKDIETIRNSLNTAIAQKKEIKEFLNSDEYSEGNLINHYYELYINITNLINQEQAKLTKEFNDFKRDASKIQSLNQIEAEIDTLQSSIHALVIQKQDMSIDPDSEMFSRAQQDLDKKIAEANKQMTNLLKRKDDILSLQSKNNAIDLKLIEQEWDQLDALKSALKNPNIKQSSKKSRGRKNTPTTHNFDLSSVLSEVLKEINQIDPALKTPLEELSEQKADANITANQEPEEIIESEEIIEPEDENTKDNIPDNDLDEPDNSDTLDEMDKDPSARFFQNDEFEKDELDYLDDLDEPDDPDDLHELDDLDDLDDHDTLEELDKDPSARFFKNDEFEFENNEDENKLDEPVEPVEPVVEPVEPVEPIEQPKQHKSSIDHIFHILKPYRFAIPEDSKTENYELKFNTTKSEDAFKDILEYSKHVTYSSPQATRVESPIADDKTHIVSDPHIVEGEYENTEPPIVKEKLDNSEDTIDEMNPPPATKPSFLRRAFTALVLPLVGLLTLFGVINNRNHSTTITLPASNAQEREIDNNDENLTYSDSGAEHISPSQIEADSEQIISETTVNDSSVPTASEDKDLSSSPISPTPTPITPTLTPTSTPTPPPQGSPEFYLQASQEYGDLAKQYHEEAENFKREAEDYKTQAEQARGEGNYDLAKSYDKDAEKAENNYKDSKKLEKRATNAANFYKEKAEKEAKKEAKKGARKADEEAKKAKEETKKSEEEAKKQQDKFKDEIKVPPQQSPIPAEYDIGTQITLPKGMPHWENSEKTIGPGVFINDVDVQICAFAALDENGNYIPETRHMSRDAIEASHPGKKIMALVGGRGSDGKFDNDYENPQNWKCWVDYDSIKNLIIENSIKDFASSNLGLNITFDNYEAR